MASDSVIIGNFNLNIPKASCELHQVRCAGDGCFAMGRKIGSGSFGEIFIGRDLATDEQVRRTCSSQLGFAAVEVGDG